jgi:hypothetical protein
MAATEGPHMITTSELAGFVAAHAVWSLSEGDGFAPFIAHTTEGGERKMTPLADVAAGREQIAANPMNADDAVLVHAGRINGPNGPLDAVILEMRCYDIPGAEAAIAVPYTPKSSGQFRVHQPTLARWDGCDDFDIDTAFQAFFHGIESHEQGAKVWNAALDESR